MTPPNEAQTSEVAGCSGVRATASQVSLYDRAALVAGQQGSYLRTVVLDLRRQTPANAANNNDLRSEGAPVRRVGASATEGTSVRTIEPRNSFQLRRSASARSLMTAVEADSRLRFGVATSTCSGVSQTAFLASP